MDNEIDKSEKMSPVEFLALLDSVSSVSGRPRKARSKKVVPVPTDVEPVMEPDVMPSPQEKIEKVAKQVKQDLVEAKKTRQQIATEKKDAQTEKLNAMIEEERKKEEAELRRKAKSIVQREALKKPVESIRDNRLEDKPITGRPKKVQVQEAPPVGRQAPPPPAEKKYSVQEYLRMFGL
jgi:hypothetical protein